MKKTALKLIPAAAMLLVSAIMVSTATFAWFSMNTTVQVTGMSLTAVTPANLVVSDTGDDWTNSISLGTQNITGKLFPASSSTGSSGSFNAVTDGNYIGSGAGGVAESSTAFMATGSVGQLSSSAQANNTGYWAEYNFKLKLSETDAPTVNVYLSSLKIEDTTGTDSNGSTITDIDGAVRVALYVDGSLITIYANDNAADSYEAISGTIQEGTLYSELLSNQKTAMQAGTNYFKADGEGVIADDEDGNRFEVNGQAVNNITIVVWIEGQDEACKNSATGRSFSVDLDFSVSDTPVNP